MQADPLVHINASPRDIHILIIPYFYFLLWAACWAHFMCHHELWYQYPQYWFLWTNISERYAPFDLNLGWGYQANCLRPVISPIFSFVMTHLNHCIRSHLKGVIAAQLQWHLPNMIVIKKCNEYLICHIIAGSRHNNSGPQHDKSGPKHDYLGSNIISQGPHMIISEPRHDK